MRIYTFLCLLCWVTSEYKKSCLEFSKLTIKDSLRDLLFPKIKIILMLYSRNNLNCAEPLFEQNNLLNINFNPRKKTVWLIHGYRPMGSTPTWLQKFRNTLLNKEDTNVIVVDWNQGATTFLYGRAVKNTRIVAESLSDTVQNLLNHGVSLDNFHFIGVSLGAHICGFVGKIFHGQLGRITGLDPAGPKFSGKPSNSRLDYTDAKFVDVIHSDSKGLGIYEPLGHIDFYPNGGKLQPGCPTNIFSGIDYVKCSHQRAVHLFIASLETDCNFVSFPCRSYKDFLNGLCADCGNFNKDSCPRLGNQANLWKEGLRKRMEGWPLRTIAFLNTSGQKPYCTYYFVLSMVALNKTMMNGSISFKLLNSFGTFEYPNIYANSKLFDKEVKILAQFSHDVVNISSINIMYSHPSSTYCAQYIVKSLMLESLTYPERPPLCKYNFVLKEKEAISLQPDVCKTKII